MRTEKAFSCIKLWVSSSSLLLSSFSPVARESAFESRTKAMFIVPSPDDAQLRGRLCGSWASFYRVLGSRGVPSSSPQSSRSPCCSSTLFPKHIRNAVSALVGVLYIIRKMCAGKEMIAPFRSTLLFSLSHSLSPSLCLLEIGCKF